MMRCPTCDAELPKEDLETCPNCGNPLKSRSVKRIELAVKENHGKVVGIAAKNITGDVFASGDFYQVQVYVLSRAGRKNAFQFLDSNRSPYKFLFPYSPRDVHLFFGRDQDTEDVLRRVSDGRLVILYGAAGVGKTSLLSAGVIPNLLSHGALVVHIQDYTQPLGATYRRALAAERNNLKLNLPPGDNLGDLVKAVRQQGKGTQVLILDQIERIFGSRLTNPERLALLSEVVQSLKDVEEQYLRLILVVRDEAFVRLVADLQTELAGEIRIFKELKPLSREQAEAAILEPVRLVQRQIVYEPGLVRELLVPELDRLSPGESEGVHPPHLQIVCSRLYDWAVASDRLVGKQKYVKDLRGAEGILASYLDDILERDLVDQRDLAERILVALATAGAFVWTEAKEISASVTTEEVEGVLDRLADRGLVERGTRDGATVYALTSQAVEEKVFAVAGEQIEQSVQLQREIRRYWEGWKTHDDLPGIDQLRRLSRSSPSLQLEPLESLLLLRAAVHYRFPATTFLDCLRGQTGFELVARFESLGWAPDGSEGVGNGGPFLDELRLEEARRLLGLEVIPLPEQDPQFRQSFGPLARHAVRAPDRVDSQTATLVLFGGLGAQAADRLRRALHKELSGRERWRRTVSLRGLLAETDPDAAGDTSDLSQAERIGVWAWRAFQRARAEGLGLLVPLTGAGVGSGLALGTMRFLTTLLTGETPGLFAMLNFVYGGLLGVGLAAGHLTSGHLMLLPYQTIVVGKSPGLALTFGAGDQSQPIPGRRQRLFAILSGALFCFLAYLLITYTSGSLALRGKGLILGMGALASLALSSALSPALGPWPVTRLLPARWIRSASLAALALTSIQAIFIFSENIFQSLVFLWPAAAFRASLGYLAGSEVFGPAMVAFPQWYALLALIDAALAGGVLMSGLLAGLHLAWKAIRDSS
jgi:hypothetical protein